MTRGSGSVPAAATPTSPTYTGEVTAASLKATGTTGAPNAGRFVGVTTVGAPTSGTYAVGDFCVSQSGQMLVCTVAGTPGTWMIPTDSRDLLAVGEETKARLGGTRESNITMSTQALRLVYFTARKTETITQLRMVCGGTAAAATPTLVRFGIYTVASNGDLTLTASTTNDTAVFAATNTGYTKTLSASWSKVAGLRYAFGSLVVTSATAPNVLGTFLGVSASVASVAPRLVGIVTGQSDLPSSVLAGNVGADSSAPYGEMLP